MSLNVFQTKYFVFVLKLSCLYAEFGKLNTQY